MDTETQGEDRLVIRALIDLYPPFCRWMEDRAGWGCSDFQGNSKLSKPGRCEMP